MSERADATWRRSAMITPHLDHPPQVKALVDELYLELAESASPGYEAMVEAEYAGHDERVLHDRCGGGRVSVFVSPAHGRTPRRLTHLIYGGCTAHEIRQDLVRRGWGSLGITWVYPPDTVMVR